MNCRERRVAARKSPATSKASGHTASALHEAGLGHLRAGRHLDAQICCRQALALDARHADRPEHAILSYEHALKLSPGYRYALYNYAVVLLQSMRFEEALINFNLCDELQPNHAAVAQGGSLKSGGRAVWVRYFVNHGHRRLEFSMYRGGWRKPCFHYPVFSSRRRLF
jgi:tetratricopeptide (TPR) repeat protein